MPHDKSERRPWWWLAATGILLLMIGLAIWWWWKPAPPPPPPPPPPPGPAVGETFTAFIKGLHYVPIAIPRDTWGPGTIIKFVDDQEQIVRFNKQCLKLSVPVVEAHAASTDDTDVAQISLPAISMDYSNSVGLGGKADITKAFDGNLHVDAALADTRVGKVVISIGDAESITASTGTIEDRTRAISQTDAACTRDLQNKDNYVVYDTIVIGGSKIGFIGKNGAQLKIDAKLLKTIGADEKLLAGSKDKTMLDIPGYRIVAYRMLRLGISNGLGETKITATTISPEETEKLREASARTPPKSEN